MKKKTFGQIAAGIIGISLVGVAAKTLQSHYAAPLSDANAKGECHGVNECKGKGECGGPNWDCAGNNSCKGQGWNTKTAAECAKLGGKFKADPPLKS
ncbi:MAG: hypothetical protein WCO71_04760 [Pseudomonadota bacterium]